MWYRVAMGWIQVYTVSGIMFEISMSLFKFTTVNFVVVIKYPKYNKVWWNKRLNKFVILTCSTLIVMIKMITIDTRTRARGLVFFGVLSHWDNVNWFVLSEKTACFNTRAPIRYVSWLHSPLTSQLLAQCLLRGQIDHVIHKRACTLSQTTHSNKNLVELGAGPCGLFAAAIICLKSG